MYDEAYEDYLTNEFNRTHAGYADLLDAERHNLDIGDPGNCQEEEILEEEPLYDPDEDCILF